MNAGGWMRSDDERAREGFELAQEMVCALLKDKRFCDLSDEELDNLTYQERLSFMIHVISLLLAYCRRCMNEQDREDLAQSICLNAATWLEELGNG